MHYYRTPAKTLQDLSFKYPGKPELKLHRAGKRVFVTRHATEPGKFVLQTTEKKYAIVAGEELHLFVAFDSDSKQATSTL